MGAGGHGMWGCMTNVPVFFEAYRTNILQNIEYTMGTSYLLIFCLKAVKFYACVKSSSFTGNALFHKATAAVAPPPSLVAIFPGSGFFLVPSQ